MVIGQVVGNAIEFHIQRRNQPWRPTRTTARTAKTTTKSRARPRKRRRNQFGRAEEETGSKRWRRKRGGNQGEGRSKLR